MRHTGNNFLAHNRIFAVKKAKPRETIEASLPCKQAQ